MKSPTRLHARGFTLVELLAVIVITLVLSGVVVGGLQYAREKQANEKTRVQLARLANALEEYKVDKGVYPPTDDSADGLGNTNALFKALYWDSDGDGIGPDEDTDQKVYVPELDHVNRKIGWIQGKNGDDIIIIDAWKSELHYRTATNQAGEQNVNTNSVDFDLWSSGKDKKSAPDAKNEVNGDNIKAR